MFVNKHSAYQRKDVIMRNLHHTNMLQDFLIYFSLPFRLQKPGEVFERLRRIF